MVVMILKGGLGNQMFQYAFGRYLSIRYRSHLVLSTKYYEIIKSDRSCDLDMFTALPCDFVNEVELNEMCLGRKVFLVTEHFYRHTSFYTSYLDQFYNPLHHAILVSGYWQSYKYFQTIEEIIKEDFKLTQRMTSKGYELIRFIANCNAVMINVRRGDYLSLQHYHGTVSKNYLMNAIEYCKVRLNMPTFFLFSDDIAWCRESLKDVSDLVIVDQSYYDPQFNLYFRLMKSCNHFILANSTFCWWAAWLGRQPNSIVVYPKNWFAVDDIDISDLTPKEWVPM